MPFDSNMVLFIPGVGHPAKEGLRLIVERIRKHTM
jgi:hypothetical protein